MKLKATRCSWCRFAVALALCCALAALASLRDEGQQVVLSQSSRAQPPYRTLLSAARERAPVLCVALVSGAAPDAVVANRTLRSVLRHLRRYERTLSYEVVWVARAENTPALEEVASGLGVSARVFASGRSSRGAAWAAATAYFALCTAPYVLALEEGQQVARGIESSVPEPRFVEQAIGILRRDATLAGVVLQRGAVRGRHLEGAIVETDTPLGPCTYRRICPENNDPCACMPGATIFDATRLAMCTPTLDLSPPQRPQCVMASCLRVLHLCCARVVRETEQFPAHTHPARSNYSK
eukprot:TRINITY_DN15810_c0_g1_i1.p1 TRINITY_DN15810_c0_g1~~TRINITY_DN15810_c0_g1_i1.p1  ORF type:complete len:307 (-),score=27.93 TRINITY_DN15810_c0_g1_i1:107-997(-)